MTQTAKTYGGALYELAKSEALEDTIRSDLALILTQFAENPDYVHLLSTPSIPKSERRTLLHEAFSGGVHPYALSFLKLLCDHGTLSELRGCARQYQLRYNDDHGILEVCAVSAVPLSGVLREKLTRKLEAVTGKTVALQTRTDESLLGGIRLELPDRQLDGTVKHHLQQLRKQLHDTVL